MTNHLDLSQFSEQQLIDLLWTLKGTPQVQPVYQELNRRPAKLTLKPNDPDWEAKLREHLLAQSEVQQYRE